MGVKQMVLESSLERCGELSLSSFVPKLSESVFKWSRCIGHKPSFAPVLG